MTMNARDYFMTWESEDLAARLIGLNQRFYGASFNPIWQMWQRNTYAYYSTVLDAQSWFTALQFVGEQGELVKMSVPQARSLIRQLVTLVTKQKLAFLGLAKTEGAEVTENIRICNAVCEEVVEKTKLDLLCEQFVEDGMVTGTGFIKTTWRSDLGAPIAVVDEDERVVYEGDIEITVPHIMDMLYNFQIPRWEDLDWAQVRVRRNRWTLIAQHPELKEALMKLPAVSTELRSRSYMGFDDNDTVYIYEMYHKPTPSLPRGRILIYGDAKCVLYDDVNNYGCIPIEQYKPEAIKGLNFGYPMLSNLLPAQEMYDHEFSSIATNHGAMGVQNVTAARGSDINVEALGGMNYIFYTPQDIPGGGKPEPLNLLQDSPNSLKFAEILLANMQQISNINAAVRGEIPQSSSGVAIATLTTNALEFLTSYTKSMISCLERTMYHSVTAYRKFARTERLVRMTGKNFQSFTRKFNPEDLDPIVGVKIQTINPLMQTMAGRVEIADKAIERGLVQNMQEYVSILDGEPLNKLFQPQSSQNDLIQSENDALMDGTEVIVLSTDNHPRHIMMHSTLLNDPIVRADGQRVNLILNHILQHLELAKNTDPVLMAMVQTGQMPPMPPPGMAPPGMAPPGMPPEMGAEGMPPPGSGEPGLPTEASGGAEVVGLPTPEVAQPAQDKLGRR